jgi:YidC/Oxa1 family membrane protein insertase
MTEVKRNFLFIASVFLIVVGTQYLFNVLFGPAKRPPGPAAKPAAEQAAKPDAEPGDVKDGEPKDEQPDAPKAAAHAVEQPAPKPEEPKPEPATRVIGSIDAESGYKMQVELTNEGATVRRIELTGYFAENRNGPLALVAVEPGELGSLGLDVPNQDANLAERIWQIVDDAPQAAGAEDQPADADQQSVRFQTTIPGSPLVITKTFRLKKGSHNLELDITIANAGDRAANVSYLLGGPRGFVLEGAWYSTKLRDAVIGDGAGATLKRHTIQASALDKGAKKILELEQGQQGIAKSNWTLPPDWFDRFDVDTNAKLTGDEIRAAAFALAGGERNRWEKNPVRFAGVDSQFFSAFLVVPTPKSPEERWDAATVPVLVSRNSKNPERGDVSVELQSRAFRIAAGESLEHNYALYAGPRKRDVLQAAIGDPAVIESIINFQGVIIFPDWLVGFTANSMLFLLQMFHKVVPNWGVAIIMLTVLVRLCLLPLSRKQALRAQIMQQKMASLKPELDKLKEKYKNDVQKYSQAQFELMKKHGVDPRSQLAGCLPLLLQMPIFIGLWQGLSSSIDLRQAVFFGWIDDLSAPDQLFKWGENIPLISWAFGPYFNLLPAILMALFFVQQKMFMPPQTSPPDPQVEMQQKMMTWMMLMFGYFFWRLPSGLCLYYIASTLWGIAERKLLPKIQHAPVVAAKEPEREERERGRKSPRRDARGPKSPDGDGLSLKERFEELLKKASKK